MNTFRNLNVKYKLFSLIAISVIGFLIFGFTVYETLSTVKVNGEIYNDIVTGKDLLADILPPPLFITEAYSIALEMEIETDQGRFNVLTEEFAKLKKDFEDRQEFWKKELVNPGDEKMNSLLTGDAKTPAMEFFAIVENEYIPALKSGNREKAHQLLLGPIHGKFEEQKTVVNELAKEATADAKRQEEIAASAVKRGTYTLIFVGVLVMLFSVLAGIFIANGISKPLNEVAGKLASLAKTGDVNQHISYQSNDEIGNLANSFRSTMSYLTNVSAVVGTVGNGDVHNSIQPLSNQDILATSLNSTIYAIRDLIEETSNLTNAAQAGNINIRGAADNFKGGYRELIEGINNTLEAMVKPINEASDCLQKVAGRDLTAKMVGDYKGDFALIKNSLNAAVDNLDEGLTQVSMGAEQVASAANEISSASQSLAQGSSEQASTLEEVASSLQEISSITKQNSSNSQEARSLAENATTTAQRGMESMTKLSQAVDKIKASSDSTAKIVKTIEEIAFQTNLLALNAAVEAARAGDAGKGFAVVAEEVRNLAMRSAEAAKTTAKLIDESVKNTEEGVELNAEVLENLEDINRQIEKVNVVVTEIATASKMQSQGVEQINVAVDQMNGVTQQIAANSEESASAAEELSGQSQEMLSLIGRFTISNGSGMRSPSYSADRSVSFSKSQPTFGSSKPKTRISIPKSSGSEASMLIPFDDMDDSVLSDF